MYINEDNYIEVAEELAEDAKSREDALYDFVDEIIQVIKPFIDKYDNSWKYWRSDPKFGGKLIEIDSVSFIDKLSDSELQKYRDAWDNEQQAAQYLEDAGKDAEVVVSYLRDIVRKFD